MSPILVVEDEKGIRDLLKTIMRIHNIPAIFADTGNKALDIIADKDLSLILCDFMLPDVNGDVILQSIRHNKRTNKLPFIFLSAFADKEDIKRGLSAGADDYITKPFTINCLIATIKQYISY